MKRPGSILKWVVLVGAAEALLTGVVTVVSPPLFCRLLLGAKLAVSGPALGPLAGIAMLGTGLAAWPSPKPLDGSTRVGRALLAYNVLAMSYLAYLAAGGRYLGVLLWPAVALHAILSALLAYGLVAQSEPIAANRDRTTI